MAHESPVPAGSTQPQADASWPGPDSSYSSAAPAGHGPAGSAGYGPAAYGQAGPGGYGPGGYGPGGPAGYGPGGPEGPGPADAPQRPSRRARLRLLALTAAAGILIGAGSA